jgi:hypothetical protein
MQPYGLVPELPFESAVPVSGRAYAVDDYISPQENDNIGYTA